MTSESDGSGRIGEWAHDLKISDHSLIQSTNSGGHDATMTSGIEAVNHTVSMTETADGKESSGLVSLATGDGAGGSIKVLAKGSIKMEGNSEIRSESQGRGQGGTIRLSAGSLDIHNSENGTPSGIQSISRSDSVGGSIEVSARNSILISGNARIGTYAENIYPHETGGDTGNLSISAKNILVTDRENYLPGEITGFIVSQSNHDGRAGDITINTKGELTFRGDYHYDGVPLNTSKHITGIAYINNSTEQAGALSIHSGGYISIFGKGSRGVSNGSSEYAFRNASAYPGVFVSGLNDDPHPGDLSIFSSKGLSLENAAILSQSNAHFPNIRVKTQGLFSLNHSDIEYYLMDSHPNITREASIIVSGGEVLLTHNSAIHGSAPNTSINVLSKGDIVVDGTPLLEKDSHGNARLDPSIFYHGYYGNGGVQLKASGSILLSNTLVGGVASVDPGEVSRLHIRVISENLVLNNSALLLNSAMDQLDVQNSQIKLSTQALFPLANSLNNGFYTSGISVIYFPGFIPPPSQNNLIQEKSSTSKDPNFELSGSLFGISGILTPQDPIIFDADKIDTLCEIDKKGSLSISGKGQSKHQFGTLWQ